MFGDFYSGKRVLVTGHTGFKGSWLALWLSDLGATVIGYALEPPGRPSHFEACGLSRQIIDLRGDILDFEHLLGTFREHQPEIVFHLAAQPLVRVAYQKPRETFGVNVMGTTNTLEAARQVESVQQFIAVTSDKVYRNSETNRPFRESDELGGYEPYGASKACAELVVAAYQDRRFQDATQTRHPLAIASVRAGNVIGGGDWGQFRIIPDIVRAIEGDSDLIIRYPQATRPWQHVLDSLSGYLWLGCRLAGDPIRFASAWNFGPMNRKSLSVNELVRAFLQRWPAPESMLKVEPFAVGEHQLLQVDSTKAIEELGWRPAWNIEQTLDATIDWYRTFHRRDEEPIIDKSRAQIRQYCQAAVELDIHWATGKHG